MIIRYNFGDKTSVVGHNSKAGWVRSVAVAAREYHRAGVKDCLAVDAGLMVALGRRVARYEGDRQQAQPLRLTMRFALSFCAPATFG